MRELGGGLNGLASRFIVQMQRKHGPAVMHVTNGGSHVCMCVCVCAQVRTLASQVRLDARTKLLNPKWYEGMLSSGYEGVREIQKRLTNTMGWSATSGQV